MGCFTALLGTRLEGLIPADDHDAEDGRGDAANQQCQCVIGGPAREKTRDARTGRVIGLDPENQKKNADR